MSGILIYLGGIVVSPFIIWVLWFIGAFFYSYVAGNEIEEGVLNYFSSIDDHGFMEVNLIGWLLWPLYITIGIVACIGFVVYSIGSWVVTSLHFDKFNLTERINQSVRNRKKAKNG